VNNGAVALVASIGVGGACAGVVGLVVRPTPRLGPRFRPYNHVARTALGLAPDVMVGAQDNTMVARFFAPLMAASIRGLSRRIESRSDDELERVLYQAGRADVGVEQFRLRQVARGALGAVGFGAVALAVARVPIVVLAMVLAGFVWGTSRVRAGVDAAVERRTGQIRLELGTVAQLLALHLRTGAGPVQAVQRFAARGRGVLADEMSAVVASIRAGSREADAFRRAAALTPSVEAARMHLLFANGVDRGADLAAALLTIADDVRDARRDEVKRRSIKSRAAMLIPTIGILAPVMLLFIAAPLPSIVFGSR
jgi:Flp pilus assembly protein TadB